MLTSVHMTTMMN